MGIFDYVSEKCDFTIPRRVRSLKTVDIEVNIDCKGCERRIRKTLSRLKGARKVEINREQGRVTVEGYMDERDVLDAVRRTGKGADLWQYVPYNLVAYPYAAEAYDQKAPPGYVRDVPQAFGEDSSYLFSDENPHACAIM